MQRRLIIPSHAIHHTPWIASSAIKNVDSIYRWTSIPPSRPLWWTGNLDHFDGLDINQWIPPKIWGLNNMRSGDPTADLTPSHAIHRTPWIAFSAMELQCHSRNPPPIMRMQWTILGLVCTMLRPRFPAQIFLILIEVFLYQSQLKDKLTVNLSISQVRLLYTCENISYCLESQQKRAPLYIPDSGPVYNRGYMAYPWLPD